MLLTIAIPAYDEVANLGRAVGEARGAAARVAPGDAEILVVDDGSRDGTAAVADGLAKSFADVRVVRHATNRGFSGAMTTCFREARGDWVVLVPADGQTPMTEVLGFFERLGDADIVVGVRRTERTELRRRVLSRGFHLIARKLFGLPEREFQLSVPFPRLTPARHAIPRNASERRPTARDPVPCTPPRRPRRHPGGGAAAALVRQSEGRSAVRRAHYAE